MPTDRSRQATTWINRVPHDGALIVYTVRKPRARKDVGHHVPPQDDPPLPSGGWYHNAHDVASIVDRPGLRQRIPSGDLEYLRISSASPYKCLGSVWPVRKSDDIAVLICRGRDNVVETGRLEICRFPGHTGRSVAASAAEVEVSPGIRRTSARMIETRYRIRRPTPLSPSTNRKRPTRILLATTEAVNGSCSMHWKSIMLIAKLLPPRRRLRACTTPVCNGMMLVRPRMIATVHA